MGRCAALAAVLAAGFAAQSADAAISGAGFTINIAASARVLNAIGTPQYSDVLMQESCDNPHLRIRKNNKPAIMLTVNDTLSAGAELASFTISINNPLYLFGDGDGGSLENFTQFIQESVYTDAGVSITSNTLSADLRSLTLDFDGLTAGKKVIFNVDLDAINDPSMFLYPDYRTVLNGAPIDLVSPPTDPASFAGTFSDGDDTLVASGRLQQMTLTPQYANSNIRPYHSMDMIEVTTTDPVPEPAAIGLAGLAIFALGVLRRNSGR